MTENYKFSSFDEKNAETADDFYPASRTQDYKNSNVNLLQVNLNSQRTKLRSCQYEQAALKEKLNEFDLKAGKLTIANEYLSGEAESVAAKNDELLNHKGVLLDEIKDWKDASACLKEEANKCSNQMIEWRKKVVSLEECQQDLRQKIQIQNELNQKVQDYSMNMEGHIQQADNELAQVRLTRDGLVQNLTTLQTFAKSFKKNILEKGKELSRCQYESGELQNMIATKNFERANFHKEKEKADWECKMYVHHNKEIEKTNSKLKLDLEKLMNHLESLKKTNKNLGNCVKEYSETGIAAAKKILTQSNK